MRQLASQLMAEQHAVQRNQHDPVRQTDNDTRKIHVTTPVRIFPAFAPMPELCHPIFVGISRNRRKTTAATIAASAVSPSNQ